MDVNGNGIIDAPDTLVNGVNIILNNNGVAVDTVTSDMNGNYSFANILSTDYVLQVDLSNLPSNVVAVYNNIDTSLVGCDVMETVDWLLEISCIATIQNFDDETCFGEDYIFDGVVVPSGVPMSFDYLSALGCDSTIIVTITELPNNAFTTELNACDGNDVVYNGVAYPAGSTTQVPLVSPQGCSYFETVEVVPFPTSSTNIDLEVCVGEMGEYNGQQLAAGSQTEFTFPNQFGCDSIVVVSVIAFPEIEFDMQTNEPCWNSNDGTITITTNSGTAPFEYSVNGINFQPDPFFENLVPMNYDVIVADANGCEVEQAIFLESIPKLAMNLPTPLLPCDGSGVILQPQILSAINSNITYIWSDGSTDPTLSATDEGIYVLAVTNECETITEEVNVSYENDGIDDYMYIPNAFSPDGDGSNDIFKIYPSPDIEVLTFDFYIFDRWGNHLYDTNNVEEGWDGWMNGKEFNTGVYVYYIRADIMSCGRRFEVFKKGDVTITK